VPGTHVPRIAFDRRKYGRHLLLDVARVRELHGFIIGAPHSLAFFEITPRARGDGTVHRAGAGPAMGHDGVRRHLYVF
jgi:hypothetical protein